MNDPNCPYCHGTGERDSGGTHPWGAPAMISCDCNSEAAFLVSAKEALHDVVESAVLLPTTGDEVVSREGMAKARTALQFEEALAAREAAAVMGKWTPVSVRYELWSALADLLSANADGKDPEVYWAALQRARDVRDKYRVAR